MTRSKNSKTLLSSNVSKRTFISALGATAVGLGFSPKARAADDADTYDLIVIGGGNAGHACLYFRGQTRCAGSRC